MYFGLFMVIELFFDTLVIGGKVLNCCEQC